LEKCSPDFWIKGRWEGKGRALVRKEGDRREAER